MFDGERHKLKSLHLFVVLHVCPNVVMIRLVIIVRSLNRLLSRFELELAQNVTRAKMELFGRHFLIESRVSADSMSQSELESC